LYFDDSEYDFPKIAHRMRKLDAAGSVLDEDGKGGCCFDRMTFTDPFDILGFFLGYMRGPIIAESREEREERAHSCGDLTGTSKPWQNSFVVVY
jgi:hypothetical protein